MNSRIKELADSLGVTIAYDAEFYPEDPKKARGPFSVVELKEVHLLPLEKDVSEENNFWTALHELGHVATTFEKQAELDSELDAWEWAIQNAGKPLNDTGKASIAYALSAYILNIGIPSNATFNRILKEVGKDPDFDLTFNLPELPTFMQRIVWEETFEILSEAGRV